MAYGSPADRICTDHAGASSPILLATKALTLKVAAATAMTAALKYLSSAAIAGGLSDKRENTHFIGKPLVRIAIRAAVEVTNKIPNWSGETAGTDNRKLAQRRPIRFTFTVGRQALQIKALPRSGSASM
ncbi:MAG: hypothetical protein U0936_22495 [Planctomycetaceae bacterium]